MGLIRPMAALPLGGKVELLVVTNLFFLATFFLEVNMVVLLKDDMNIVCNNL